jgi:hypothetical protein
MCSSAPVCVRKTKKRAHSVNKSVCPLRYVYVAAKYPIVIFFQITSSLCRIVCPNAIKHFGIFRIRKMGALRCLRGDWQNFDSAIRWLYMKYCWWFGLF